MKYIRLSLAVLLMVSVTFADAEKIRVYTLKTLSPPIIDGVVEETIWESVQPATDFYRFEPESGGHAPVKTEIRILYDDVALYVAATMYDPEPGEIPTQLGKRDDADVVADWLGLWISPFNDGTNELVFIVTAAGVQADKKSSPNSEDDSWNPVWSSDISIHEQGWSLEMAIPFSQIRFPAKDIQTWGFNVARYRAKQREVYTWTSLDKGKENYAQQAGLLLGIQNIETPLRLSLTPYAAVSMEHYPTEDSEENVLSTIYRGGMDLKYGINESFTLDMTLIPDYGQVQSDNVVLNLSPFEVRYDEHRPFFTEGTQLLHKAGLFYSRRVGSRPARYWHVADEEILEAGEEILSNPDETQLINATKVTGQTVNGIGLAVFNAITAPAHAILEDSLGSQREYLTNPLTNYNLVVVSKNLKNGSDFSVANTNVQRFSSEDSSSDFRDANVIGFETRLLSKDSKWVFELNGAYDQLFYPDSESTGFNYHIAVAEEQGAMEYGLGHVVESEFYNPNDMGYLQQPNEVTQYAWLAFKTLDPVWRVNFARFSMQASQSSLFNPRVYTETNLNGNYNVTFRNYYAIGGGFSWRPKEAHSYDETRVDGRYFTIPTAFDTHLWVSSNYSKALAVDAWVGISTITRRQSQWRGGGFSPRWRVNNRWLMSYNLELNYNINNHGFADFDTNDDPVFGKRDRNTVTNTFYSSYIFSRDLESDIRIRHYRSSVEYLAFFDLMEDGNLSPRDYDENLNTVFNAFTIDAVMTWRFAPGSEMNITWKNAIYADGDDPSLTYLDDLRNLPSLDQSNSISLKLLYYVDAWDLKHRF